MDEIHISTQQAYLYTFMIGAAIGFVVGLIPLIIGIWKKKAVLGIVGLLATTIGCGLLGLLLAIPTAAVFTWLILRKAPTSDVAEPDAS